MTDNQDIFLESDSETENEPEIVEKETTDLPKREYYKAKKPMSDKRRQTCIANLVKAREAKKIKAEERKLKSEMTYAEEKKLRDKVTPKQPKPKKKIKEPRMPETDYSEEESEYEYKPRNKRNKNKMDEAKVRSIMEEVFEQKKKKKQKTSKPKITNNIMIPHPVYKNPQQDTAHCQSIKRDIIKL